MLTLIEAAKSKRGTDDVGAGYIETFVSGSVLLQRLPIQPISGGAYRYDQEQTLPGVAFRGLNEGYAESVGVVNPQTENLVLLGGDIDVDKALVRRNGPQERTKRERMKIKALAHEFFHKFIKGDSESDPKEFDGLQRRLTGGQLIENHAGTGTALSMLNLDELMDAVDGAGSEKVLFMSQALRRRLTQASRDSAVGGRIDRTVDAFGRQVMTYNDAPIIEADQNGAVYATLGFNEAAAGGGSASTSIYCARLGEGYLQGIQNGGIDTADLGEIDEKPVLRTRFEWDCGVVIEHPRAAARLRGITDAAPTAS